jgi:hypothetical protein
MEETAALRHLHDDNEIRKEVEKFASKPHRRNEDD